MIKALQNLWKPVLFLNCLLLTTGCVSGGPKTVGTVSRPEIAKANPVENKVAIEVIIGARPDYFRQMKEAGLDEDFIKAAGSLQEAMTGWNGPSYGLSWENYWRLLFDALQPYETKRSITDFYYAMAFIDALKKRFPNSVVYLRPANQNEVFAEARDFNYLKSNEGHAWDFPWVPVQNMDYAWRATWESMIVKRYLLGYPVIAPVDTNSPALISIDFRTDPGMEVSQRRSSTYGRTIASMAQAYVGSSKPVWNSLDLKEVQGGKMTFFEKKRFRAGLGKSSEVDPWLSRYFTNSPTKNDWVNYINSIQPILDED